MKPNQAAVDPYVNSVQWSRRFLGLRLFLSLGAAGWAGHGAHVERCVDTPEHQRRMLTKNVLSALGYLLAGLLAFRYVWVSYAIFAAVPVMYFLPDGSLVELASKSRKQY